MKSARILRNGGRDSAAAGAGRQRQGASVGFWLGNAASPTPLYYSYAYPEPPGLAEAKVQPAAVSYYAPLHEFVLPYDRVRRAGLPDAMLIAFAQSEYDSSAHLGT